MNLDVQRDEKAAGQRRFINWFEAIGIGLICAPVAWFVDLVEHPGSQRSWGNLLLPLLTGGGIWLWTTLGAPSRARRRFVVSVTAALFPNRDTALLRLGC